jgi:hypothetical protein
VTDETRTTDKHQHTERLWRRRLPPPPPGEPST